MQNQYSNTRDFTIIWIGQVISMLGSATIWFALSIWAYQASRRATDLALPGFLVFGAAVLFSPVAGAPVDG